MTERPRPVGLQQSNFTGAYIVDGADLTDVVLDRVLEERRREYVRYGDNWDNEDGTGPTAEHLHPICGVNAEDAQMLFRKDYNRTEAKGRMVTWAQLLREEVSEAFQEDVFAAVGPEGL